MCPRSPRLWRASLKATRGRADRLGQPFAAGRTKVGARFIVPSTAEGAAKPRPYPQPPCGGQVAGITGAQRGTGNRMIGRVPIFRSRVSAIRHLVRVLRFRFGFRKSVICHLSSIQPSQDFGWRVAAPGGRWRGFSIQSSIQSSTQPSIQTSVIDSARPEEARSARSADPTSRQCPEITKNQELRTA